MSEEKAFRPTLPSECVAIFDNCPTGIAACDRDGIYIFANPAYAKIYGYTPDELVGKSFMDIKTLDDKRPVQEGLLAELLEGQKPVEPFEKWDSTRDGTEILVSYNAEYLKDDEGKAYGSLVFIRDVTPKKEMSDKIREMDTRIKASQKLETLGRISGGVVHDFNNRLNVILGLSSTLRMQTDEETEQHEMLTDIVTASRQAAELTQKLLLFSREAIITKSVCSLREVVEEAVTLTKRLSLQPIEWQVDSPDFESFVNIDNTSIQNAIFNILLNATEAMQDGGNIQIKYDLGDSKIISLNIVDDGPGMSEEVLQKIFDPFFSTKLSKKGTGLGLAAVKQAVVANDGEVDVESSLGEGTQVTLKFAQADPDEISFSTDSYDFQQQTHSLNVLVVDDEEDVLKSTAKVLESLGHKGVGFTDPFEAKEWYTKSHSDIDAILLDVMLPSMSGIDLMKELAAIKKDVPIILMSGYALQEAVEQAVQDYASGFLHKPFSAEEVGRELLKIIP